MRNLGNSSHNLAHQHVDYFLTKVGSCDHKKSVSPSSSYLQVNSSTTMSSIKIINKLGVTRLRRF